ncbi:MAG: S1C family serine protease [Kiloniellales bacterium]|nr:S1C family serine protease [Kiloniellales bacterium]
MPASAKARRFQNPSALRGLLLLAALVAVLLALSPARADVLDAVVGVRATIPADARTAPVLGTQREGSGVVIGEAGLVLTIGYLILEAESAEILLPEDRALPAEILAYDYDTGFGLLRAIGSLDVEPIPLGSSDALDPQSRVLVASFADSVSASAAFVVSRREFAGYWEYLLPQAIFTTPPHPGYGGASLIGEDGRLLGIGSLLVADAAEDAGLPGNMFVPIDALKPILAELLEKGRAAATPRPWLGVYAEEAHGRVFVTRVAPEGPAAAAGLEAEDLILAVKGEPVADTADFYRKIWALGDAGVKVPLTVLRGAQPTDLTVTSGDRYDYLKLQHAY